LRRDIDPNLKNQTIDPNLNPTDPVGCGIKGNQCSVRAAVQGIEVGTGEGSRYKIRASLRNEIEALKKVVSFCFTF